MWKIPVSGFLFGKRDKDQSKNQKKKGSSKVIDESIKKQSDANAKFSISSKQPQAVTVLTPLSSESPHLPEYTKTYDYEERTTLSNKKSYKPHGFSYEDKQTSPGNINNQQSPTSASKKFTGFAFNYAPGDEKKVAESAKKREIKNNEDDMVNKTSMGLKTQGLDYVESARLKELQKNKTSQVIGTSSENNNATQVDVVFPAINKSQSEYRVLPLPEGALIIGGLIYLKENLLEQQSLGPDGNKIVNGKIYGKDGNVIKKADFGPQGLYIIDGLVTDKNGKLIDQHDLGIDNNSVKNGIIYGPNCEPLNECSLGPEYSLIKEGRIIAKNGKLVNLDKFGANGSFLKDGLIFTHNGRPLTQGSYGCDGNYIVGGVVYTHSGEAANQIALLPDAIYVSDGLIYDSEDELLSSGNLGRNGNYITEGKVYAKKR